MLYSIGTPTALYLCFSIFGILFDLTTRTARFFYANICDDAFDTVCALPTKLQDVPIYTLHASIFNTGCHYLDLAKTAYIPYRNTRSVIVEVYLSNLSEGKWPTAYLHRTDVSVRTRIQIRIYSHRSRLNNSIHERNCGHILILGTSRISFKVTSHIRWNTMHPPRHQYSLYAYEVRFGLTEENKKDMDCVFWCIWNEVLK